MKHVSAMGHYDPNPRLLDSSFVATKYFIDSWVELFEASWRKSQGRLNMTFTSVVHTSAAIILESVNNSYPCKFLFFCFVKVLLN